MRRPSSLSIPALGVMLSAAVVLAACNGSGSSAKTTTKVSVSNLSGTTSATTAPVATTAPPTAAVATTAPPTSTSGPSSSGQGAPASAALVAPLCGLLDTGTVVSVVGGVAPTCQDFAAGDDDAGRALWGKLGPSQSSLEITAFTGAALATRAAQWQAVFPAVPGVGQGAWSRGVVSVGPLQNLVLYVDYGTFGLEFAIGKPSGLTPATAVTLAQSIK